MLQEYVLYVSLIRFGTLLPERHSCVTRHDDVNLISQASLKVGVTKDTTLQRLNTTIHLNTRSEKNQSNIPVEGSLDSVETEWHF